MSNPSKCPNCASNLFFDADQQKMSCSNCGAKVEEQPILIDADEVSLPISIFSY